MNKPLLFAALFLLLLLLVLRFFTFFRSSGEFGSGKEVTFTTTLLSSPQVSGRTQKFNADISFLHESRISIIVPSYPQYHYGDTLSISGSIQDKKLQNGQTIKTISFPQIHLVPKKIDLLHPVDLLLSLSSAFQQKVIALFSQTLPAESSSLLLGIVFGIKSGMPQQFQNDLRTTGVLHVIAASGMNVTMTASFFTLIFGMLFRRQVSIIASILAIFFYAFVAGFEPSIIRACLMAGVAFSAQLFGRQNRGLFALFLTAIAMLFYKPSYISDVSFQLSFASTFGILFFKPLVDRAVAKFTILQKIISDDISTSFSAQLFTLPIILIVFGSYGLLSLLVNALVLWTIPILMILGGIGALVGIVVPFLGKFLLYLALPFLLFFEKVVTLFGGAGLVLTISLPVIFVVAYYCFLLAATIQFKKNTTL